MKTATTIQPRRAHGLKLAELAVNGLLPRIGAYPAIECDALRHNSYCHSSAGRQLITWLKPKGGGKIGRVFVTPQTDGVTVPLSPTRPLDRPSLMSREVCYDDLDREEPFPPEVSPSIWVPPPF